MKRVGAPGGALSRRAALCIYRQLRASPGLPLFSGVVPGQLSSDSVIYVLPFTPKLRQGGGRGVVSKTERWLAGRGGQAWGS